MRARVPVLLSCLLACSGGPPPERAAPPPAPVPVKTRPPAPPPPARPKPPTGPFVEPARPAEAPPVAGQIGTTGPITLLASTPDGHAAVVCQARVDSNRDGKIEVKAGMHGERFGDEMRPYLVIGDGPGLPLDAFHAIDPLGGRLVATRGDQLQLIDLSTGAAIVLGKPPARPEAHSPFTGGRVAAFDLDGKHMLYLRRSTRRDGQPDLVLRDQASGAETLVDWGRGRLWRAGFDGAFIEVEVADGSPRGMPPIHVRGDLDPSGGERCRGFYMEFGEWRRGGEELHRRFLRVGAGGPAAEIADLVEIFGDAVLRRQPDGGYALTDDAGTSVLVPASCGPVLLHVSGKLPAALVACTGGKPLAKDADGLDPELPLVIYDRAGAHPLGVSETIDADPGDAPIYKRSGLPRWPGISNPYSSLTTFGSLGGDLIDYTRLRAHDLLGTAEILYRDRALVHLTDHPYRILDVVSLRELPIAASISIYPHPVAAGRWVAVAADKGPRPLLDFDSGTVAGYLYDEPFALSDTGWALVPSVPAVRGFSGGPLVWKAPAPPP